MAIMHAKDAIRGNTGECYVTIDGERYHMMTLKKISAELEYSNGEVPRLGANMMGHKEGIAKGTWTASGYYGTPMLRRCLLDYKETGIFPEINIQIINEDMTSAAGRQSAIIKECLIDKAILATLDAEEEFIEEEISDTFDDWELPEEFTKLSGM